MRKPQYAYFVTLADGSRHLVITHSYSDNHTGVYFRRHLQDVMRREARIEESRISIQNFWFHGEMDPDEGNTSRAA
jgi:hypothetical protein